MNCEENLSLEIDLTIFLFCERLIPEFHVKNSVLAGIVLRLNSIPLLFIFPILAVRYPEGYITGDTAKLYIKSLVFLSYHSTDPLMRLLNREKSTPTFNISVRSHFKFGLESLKALSVRTI